MENPSYYAVIPADVRYDKRITDKAKLLYGEIAALCNKNGVCTASNAYFASLYGVNVTTISTLINSLVKNGYLESEIIYKEGTKEIQNRYLKISKDPLLKNQKDNNTSNNNIYPPISPQGEDDNQTDQGSDEDDFRHDFEILWGLYPKKDGKLEAYKHYKSWMKGKSTAFGKIKLTNEQMKSAIEAYCRELQARGTEKRYIKMGSTFFNNDIYDYVQKEGD